MSKKAIIELELKADGYKADVAEIQKANTTISESATKAANQATEAYTQTGKAAKAAFASTEVQKALTDQNNSVKTLTASLDKLYQEEVELLSANKQATEAYRRNREEADKLRAQIANLTKQTDQYNKATDNTEKKAKSLTGQLRAMKQELALLEQEGKDGTAEFNKLATAAARLEDQIGDTRERVRVLASDTFAFDVAVDATQNLAGAFSAVQGAVGLFAEDNEALQKTIAKTNSALALLNGLQQINAFVTGQSSAKIAIQNVLQKINDASVRQSAVSYNLLGKSIRFTSVELNVLKGAFAAIGIGLIVFAISELIKGFEKLSEENERFTKAFTKSNEAIKASQQGINSLANIAFDAQTKIAIAAGKITQSQAELNKELKNIKTTATEAYAPIISAQLDLNRELQKVNDQIEKQRNILKSLEGVSGADAAEQRRASEKTLNAELLKKDKIEKELIKLDLRKQEVSKNSIAAQVAVTNASKIETKEKEKAIKQTRIQIQLLSDEAIKRNQIALATIDSLIKLNEIEDTSAQTRIRTRENTLQTIELLEGSSLQTRITLIELEGERRKLDAQEQIEDQKEKATAIELIDAQTQEAIRAERKKTAEESIRLAQLYVQEFVSLANELNELSKINTENSINDINLRSEAELNAINQSLDTERQKQREREALEFRTNRAIAAEKTKQAKRDKALALFQAGINLATSIVKTGAELGYPAAIPFQVAAGIIGAAQIAAIASQPIPKFEKGGEIVKGRRHRDGGTLIEAEQGEYIVNRNQTRRHSEELSALNRSTAEFHRLLERKYIQPRIASILSGTNRRSDKVVVNATLNARTMEGEIKGLRKDIRRSASKGYKSNQTDTRYQWQRN
jgi:hypothetical protein